MNAFTDAVPDEPEVTARTLSCTFGHYADAVWTDRRNLTWDALAAILTDHQVGPKNGTCFVPATFTGERRHKNDAARIDVVVLDSDAGFTLAEIRTAIIEQGWAAVISSTHSHLTTRTRIGRGNWDKFLLTAEDPDRAPTDILLQKGYLSRVVDGATLAETTDEFAFVEHQPCPKFRIAIPLLRPWLAASYDKQAEANAAWKERIEALAAVLHLDHDQACTDTSRLFFLPRHPADGPPPETAVLEGDPCDLFSLPAAPRPEPKERTGKARGRGRQRQAAPDDSLTFTDQETGEVLDLRDWSRKHAGQFEIVAALRARRPDVFTGKVAESTRHHLRCVNEEAHTHAGADAATFVVNASESTSRGFVHHCRHAHCDGRDRLLFLHQMLQQGWLRVADLTDPAFLADNILARPLIRFVGGEIAAIVDRAEDALIGAELAIYQRGGFVVRPGIVSVSIAQGQEVSAQRIIEVGDHALVEAMTVAADWEKFDARSEGWVRIDAPLKVAATYKQRIGHWRLPILTGIVNAPTLRADGSILAEPGYDRATGLLLDTRGETFPPLPERPSQIEAIRAISVLDTLVDTFPFVDRPSRAVALSAILTACIRRSLPTAPMHAFTAPTAGSGKSMLVDLASVIASGREAGVIAQGKTEEELEKRLGALLLAGDQVIAIDNCEAPLGGEFLCSMLTQTVVRPRILGRSEAPELPANAMVTATGNNLVLVGDMTRRAVLCQLDPKEERPELRTFATDPIAAVKADRGRYLVAALTVLRAYHVAGRPSAPDPLGSFAAWSNWVRGALIWVGQADPVDTIEEARDLDPKLDMLIAVLTQWSKVVGNTNVSVRDLIEAATAQRSSSLGAFQHTKPEFLHPDFREALLAVAGDGGAVNSRRLGKWLASHQNRVVQGVKITRLGLSAGIMQWRLEGRIEETAHAAP
ncbi:hypothetical protein [Roseomonas xinghualingensis]|uniref:hypothetical protein n=1 Tax=Roseomonas xinghualingensis TaxID=2986475 RepID=UPI0021F128BC|nr:hypothetical protein [Roseomonas sp. SXEYE001]MCV4210205.1 hypothetical protein [Roseomonas sp. SXEYE001]